MQRVFISFMEAVELLGELTAAADKVAAGNVSVRDQQRAALTEANRAALTAFEATTEATAGTAAAIAPDASAAICLIVAVAAYSAYEQPAMLCPHVRLDATAAVTAPRPTLLVADPFYVTCLACMPQALPAAGGLPVRFAGECDVCGSASPPLSSSVLQGGTTLVRFAACAACSRWMLSLAQEPPHIYRP